MCNAKPAETLTRSVNNEQTYVGAARVWSKISVSVKALQRINDWTRCVRNVCSANFCARKPPSEAPSR